MIACTAILNLVRDFNENIVAKCQVLYDQRNVQLHQLKVYEGQL